MRLKRFLLCLCLFLLGPLLLYLLLDSSASIPSKTPIEIRKQLHQTLASITVGGSSILSNKGNGQAETVILHLVRREIEDRNAARNADRNRNEEEAENEGSVSVTTTASNFEVRIQLRARSSPLAASWIRTLALQPDLCHQHCKFYRVEGIPKKGAVDANGYPGPPYALAQGTLLAEGFQPIPKEDTPIVARGMVCLIEQGPNFFIALDTHPEWGHGHSVIGDVEEDDMAQVDSLLKLPSHIEHWGQVRVVVLNESAPFTFRMPDPNSK